MAVNRTAPHHDPHGQDPVAQNDPLLANETLTVAEALAAYTLDAAFANGYEDVTSSIEIGKSADFAMLNRDPLAVDWSDLGDILVEQTVSAGQLVYRRE